MSGLSTSQRLGLYQETEAFLQGWKAPSGVEDKELLRELYEHCLLLEMEHLEFRETIMGLNLALERKRRLIKELGTEAEKLKGFVGAVVHDLKSPAIVISGLTRHLQGSVCDGLPSKWQQCCHQVSRTAGAMLVLIEQLNSYLATREAPLQLETLALEELLFEVENEFAARLEERAVVLSYAGVAAEIVCDRMALQRVFRNLIDNALKYGGDQLEKIEIVYQAEKHFHVISVKNDGQTLKGVAPGQLFESFQRGDSFAAKAPGSGLGLAIVREMAERHQGAAWVLPGAERGVTFCLSLARLPVAGCSHAETQTRAIF
ncbi:MAG: sensor histidine kinase [Deltaproteobacteria bacterium]|nr:sensor histidine kinase [Deltaproteobacteria bacterium]